MYSFTDNVFFYVNAASLPYHNRRFC